ncbi:MAG: MGMT family protein [Candidatus Zixiibacteriota bacterium]|nr:MAG: MGMT family protein [candidate division Zixibacteria bacterium]
MKKSPSQENSFHQRAVQVVKKIPRGRVATYGQIAALAGSPRAARQVVRVLNTASEKEKLPWHRVINREGRVVLKPGRGYELQKALLKDEGVVFDDNGLVDFDRFLWKPRTRKP